MANEPVFSEQEASKIIQRAVELSEQENTEVYKPGVTRGELERIAKEVGVPTAALARAIAEAARTHPGKQPFRLTEEFERVVEGELDPSQYDLVIEGLKPMAKAGQPLASQVGRTLSMTTWTGVGQAKVDLTSRNGRTKVKVRSNALLQALMTLHPAFITSIIAMGALTERGMAGLGAGIAIAAMSVGATLFSILTRSGHQKAEILADQLKDKIQETIAEEGATPMQASDLQIEKEKKVILES